MHRIKHAILWFMVFLFITSPIAQTTTPGSNTKPKTVKVTVNKKGEMFGPDGKKVDKRLFQETTYDSEGKKPFQLGTARKRNSEMYIDESKLQGQISNDIQNRYRTALAAERSAIRRRDRTPNWKYRNRRSLQASKWNTKTRYIDVPIYKPIDQIQPCPKGTVAHVNDPRICIKTEYAKEGKPAELTYKLTQVGDPTAITGTNQIKMPQYALTVTAGGKSTAPIPVEINKWKVVPEGSVKIEKGILTPLTNTDQVEIFAVYEDGVQSAQSGLTVVNLPKSVSSSSSFPLINDLISRVPTFDWPWNWNWNWIGYSLVIISFLLLLGLILFILRATNKGKDPKVKKVREKRVYPVRWIRTNYRVWKRSRRQPRVVPPAVNNVGGNIPPGQTNPGINPNHTTPTPATNP